MEGMITKMIFGESGETYYPTIKTLVSSINNTTYPFVSERSFIDTIKTDISQGMKMYWIEILLRAHMSASVSILRFERWMDGIIKSFVNNNFFVFSASFKSLIESAADTYDTLKDVPYGLAKNRGTVETLIKYSHEQGLARRIVSIEELFAKETLDT